ncbi:MAG TPA: glycosyltransferase family 39 protein, partial [Cyclobacteriaceae bacterium]
MEQKSTVRRQVFIVIAISTLVRLALASILELGNDEVYYWTYALYPDASHFDHPPMVGFLIQVSTLNLLLTNDLFLRLGPIVLAAFNTWIIFLIGTKIKDERAGLFASLLFTSSIYCSLIAGFAIIPDAPQVFFWLLSLYLMLDFLPAPIITRDHRLQFILFSICAGFAMLSKYHSAFLWVGAIGYILLYNRKWLSEYSLYVSLVLSFIIITPIIYWNIKHDFISFTFHGNRVTTAFQLRPDYFLRELGGQIAYNNPVNYVLIIIALIALLQKKIAINNSIRILLLTSLPLYTTFTGFSLFRSTLPHWTGPSFISLIIIAAIYWSTRLHSNETFSIPKLILLPSCFLATLLCAAVYVINYSPLQL